MQLLGNRLDIFPCQHFFPILTEIPDIFLKATKFPVFPVDGQPVQFVMQILTGKMVAVLTDQISPFCGKLRTNV